MPFVLPIKARSNKRPEPVEEDPTLRRVSQAVLLIILGFLGVMLGIMLTIFGAHSRQSTNQYRLIFGLMIIIVGICTSVAGGIAYYIFQKRRERELAAQAAGTSGSTSGAGKAPEEEENLITNSSHAETPLNGVPKRATDGTERPRQASVKVQRKRTRRKKEMLGSADGTPARSIDSIGDSMGGSIDLDTPEHDPVSVSHESHTTKESLPGDT